MMTNNIIKEQSRTYQEYYKNIFDEIHEVMSDRDCLELSIEILKVARDRLDGDLNNEYIKLEYYTINQIINQLDTINQLYK